MPFKDPLLRDATGASICEGPKDPNHGCQINPPLPTDPRIRKMLPVGTGVLDYFPNALAAVAFVSFIGNRQHNPGQPLHWARSKSTDEDDTVIRHFLEREGYDVDGCLHRAKECWRALAGLQKYIESHGGHLADPKVIEKLLSEGGNCK